MKSKRIWDGQEKTFALVFDAGEEVVAGMRQFAKDHKLSGAHLTAIGAFERLTLGFFPPGEAGFWKSWLSRRCSICAARCAGISVLPFWIWRYSRFP